MMDNKPIAVFIPAPLRYDEWKRRFALHWVDGEPIGITHLYSEDLVRQQQAEIDFLKKEILAKHEDWKHEGQQAANARAEIDALRMMLTNRNDALDRLDLKSTPCKYTEGM